MTLFVSNTFWADFAYTFIPIFVTVDVCGLIPMFLSLTKGLSEEERRQVSRQAILTAFIISAAFIVVGQLVFKVLGISVADFQIAGGLLLLVVGISEMMVGERREAGAGLHVGPVPLGTPLIVGPAVLTTLIILIPLRGYGMTFVALMVNLIIVFIAFKQSRRLVHVIGEDGLRAASQVICLFLAAIAVSMIRRGIQSLR